MLYEFLNMLVRIAFWRANPNFGLHGNKDELTPVPFALSNMLNEIILPRAKRENSAAFRSKEMQDPKLIAVLDVNNAPRDSNKLQNKLQAAFYNPQALGLATMSLLLTSARSPPFACSPPLRARTVVQDEAQGVVRQEGDGRLGRR